jgi:hypothetical protein
MKQEEIKRAMEELGEFEARMNDADLFDFQMLRKRVVDDEELDRLALRRLSELQKTYVAKRLVKDIDELLKKYTQQAKDFGPGKS